MINVNEAPHGLSRALALIEFLSLYPRGLSFTAICQQTGLAKSSAHRLLKELSELGYVLQSPDGLYSLSFKFCELSSRILSGLDLLVIAIPCIRSLCEQIGEVVHLVVPSGADIVYLRKEEPLSNTMQVMSYPGMHRPMYATASGKSMLSFMDTAQIEALWQQSAPVRLTANTITELEALYRELDVVRQRRYALDNEENELGVRCIGAAIQDFQLNPIGAVSISAPIHRMDDERISSLADKLLVTVGEISRQMGCPRTPERV